MKKNDAFVNDFDYALQQRARAIEKRAEEVGYPIDTDKDWIEANALPVRMQEGLMPSRWDVWAEIVLKFGQVLERVSTCRKN